MNNDTAYYCPCCRVSELEDTVCGKMMCADCGFDIWMPFEGLEEV